MPSLDITNFKSPFQTYLGPPCTRLHFNESTSLRCAFKEGQRVGPTWKVCFRIQHKTKFERSHISMQNGVSIKAVATMDLDYLVQSQSEGGEKNHLSLISDGNCEPNQLSTDDSAELDENERLRRMKISKANKGNVPWNKGRKHSPETLRKIRERTKLAMQDPKVKMKLVNLGHAQSKETRVKIGQGVRIGWERRRERLALQETCCLQWQNLITEASRKGIHGEDELQWDSYETLDRELEKEWQESIERRRSMPRPKGGRRAPKSPEQRRKISEAISAKWADPEYRDRVFSGLTKYHGTPVGAVRRSPRRRQMEDANAMKSSPIKKQEMLNSGGSTGKAGPKSKEISTPSYTDPLANSKLEMLKKIRKQRAAMETKKKEATERARLLIAEAEKAAKALEVAAMSNPLARATLAETRKLIAEATRSLESIDNGQINSHAQDQQVLNTSTPNPELIKTYMNGKHHLTQSDNKFENFGFDKLALQNVMNGTEDPDTINNVRERSENAGLGYLSCSLQSGNATFEHNCPATQEKIVAEGVRLGAEMGISQFRKTESSASATATRKKWVCGRLVEVEDD
ncbi:uncharacterized protein LOC18432555 isoform X2 [Amborella trichopoda]|nr:uncharacterized protein LOC18432555 isoform X2 [Amborella trichopoda]|eukprot:XP_006842720.2 uncharacterized protein LOC18432555 isoform X2 [Amborella trichopoda]